MIPPASLLPRDADDEIVSLIATLHQTEQRLALLTSGEVDSVTDHEGRTFLLRHAQEQLRHLEEAKQSAILNALPAHIALLDADGFIVSVNQAWRLFADANAYHGPGHAVGINYVDVCDNADGPDSAEAQQVADGIRAVLVGAARYFLIEYPCNSPSELRWFQMMVTPLAEGRPRGAVVMHLDISARKRGDAQLLESHRNLVEASRRAGMAEVATNVLHNVGNVLNSVNVSAGLVSENIRNSRAAGLGKVAALLREHEADLGSYITSDAKGRHIPAFLEQLAGEWLAQQQLALTELESLRGNIDHIKAIVAMQQGYAKMSGATELVSVQDLVEDSLRIDQSALVRHQITVVREFEQLPQASLQKHKVLQILVNLIRNAKQACEGLDQAQKRITLRIAKVDDRIRISVSDTGAGIAPDNLKRIFAHGFTTRKDGHGFGLNSGALAATEMGGSLSVHSDGPGCGATFTLELPTGLKGNAHA